MILETASSLVSCHQVLAGLGTPGVRDGTYVACERASNKALANNLRCDVPIEDSNVCAIQDKTLY
jgi:hypothetical protein